MFILCFTHKYYSDLEPGIQFLNKVRWIDLIGVIERVYIFYMDVIKNEPKYICNNIVGSIIFGYFILFSNAF